MFIVVIFYDRLPYRTGTFRRTTLAFDQRTLVLLTLDMCAFRIQLAEALEPAPGELPGRDCGDHRAAGFVAVAAVAEPAVGGEVRDVRKGLRQAAAVPQLQLAHARRVDQQPGVGQENQLAVGAGVPAPAVPVPDFLRAQQFLSHKAVDDRRLPHPGGSQQRTGSPDGQVTTQRLERFRPSGRDRVDVDCRRQRTDLVDLDLRIVDQVRLVQHDDRRRATLPRDQEVPLEPPWIEVAIETADQEHRVDVRRDNLLFGRVASRPAGETAHARQHRLDARITRMGRRLDGNPVTDCREIGAGGRLVPEPADDSSQPFVAASQHPVDVCVFEADPGRDEPGRAVRLEQDIQPRGPAERGEGDSHVCDPEQGGLSPFCRVRMGTVPLPRRLPSMRCARARRSSPGSAGPPRRSRPGQHILAQYTELRRRRSR
jgi:hypothetical protein